MKTSNYIITAFLTFLFGGALVLFVAAKFQPKVNLIGKDKTLPPFSVIIAEPGSAFKLKGGEPKIISYSFQDTCYTPRYEIHNDTLIVFPYAASDIKQNVEVYCKNIQAIQGKENSNIQLEETQYSNLLVRLDKARLSFYYDQNNLGSTVKVIANESYVDIKSTSFERLEAQLNHSQINAWNSSIQTLSGTLKNKSQIYGRILKNINIEADSSCNYNILK